MDCVGVDCREKLSDVGVAGKLGGGDGGGGEEGACMGGDEGIGPTYGIIGVSNWSFDNCAL